MKGERDAQFNGISSVPGKIGQDSRQKERTQSKKDKAIADDEQSSVESHGSVQVHKPKMDDAQSSVIKDGKVQVTGSQPAMDTKPGDGRLKGQSPSSKVKDKYKVHQPAIRSKCPERIGMDLEVEYSPQVNSDEEHSSELLTKESQGLPQVHSDEEYSSELLTKEPQGSLLVVQKYGTTCAVLGMNDTHCSIGYAGKQRMKLDEESDLGHLDYQLVNGKAAIGVQFKSGGENLCKSNLRMTSLMSAEKSLDTKVCSGKGGDSFTNC